MPIIPLEDEMPEPMDEVRLVKILLDIPLFDGLDYTQVSDIIRAGKQREAQPDEVLCESRTIDQRLIILLGGRARLESGEGGRLSDLTPIHLIGEMGVFTGQTRASRVVVEEPSLVLELEAEDLGELLEEDQQLGNHMLVNLVKLLYSRLHNVNDELEGVREQADRLRERLEELAPDDAILRVLFPDIPADLDAQQ